MSDLDESNVKPADSSMDVSMSQGGNEYESLDQSSIDVSQSAAIRSSRRRTKNGSAIVLNTNRIQKYIQKDAVEGVVPENSMSQILDFKEQYLQKMAPQIAQFKRKVAIVKLQRWWRSVVHFRSHNYLQSGSWDTTRADLVFALLLGYRVRKLMRSTKLVANIKAQQDVHRILSDICSTVVRGEANATSAETWEKFRVELESHSVDLLLLHYPSLSHTDMILAKSMCRQLLSERQKLHALVFGGCRWRQFPVPGFWDLSEAMRLARVSAQKAHAHAHSNVDSPGRRHSTNKNVMETPPNVRHAVKISSANAKPLPGELNLNKNSSHQVAQDLTPQHHRGHAATPPPGMQQNMGSQEEGGFINRLRHSGDRPERAVDPHLLALTPEHEQAPHAARVMPVTHHPHVPRVSQSLHGRVSASQSSATPLPSHLHSSPAQRPHTSQSSLTGSSIGSGQKKKAEANVVGNLTERRRDSSKGHLQLHVISGEKLMAARKVRINFVLSK